MRAILLIIDSFGIGALPDAHEYGDEGSNTALHICDAVPGDKWPQLTRMGLGNCADLLDVELPGCPKLEHPDASFGVLQEASAGKDTTTGHWELAGIKLEKPFHNFQLEYPSFPIELVDRFEKKIGMKILGNVGESGTVIIEQLGERHLNGEGIIVYTSADSVFQIAAHEDVIPVNRLYEICEIARELCDKYNVGRVIARPFKGEPGNFVRTSQRKDYSMVPPEPTLLDHLSENNIETVAIGKIGDLFLEKGIDQSYHDAGNKACLDRTINCMKKNCIKDQFLFINLVDTDMLYGHRRDIQGYYDAVRYIDTRLNEIIDLMSDQDILMITADHGCDPGFKGTDHTREYVPLLVIRKSEKPVNVGIRNSFCDVAQSLATFFNVPAMPHGKSFL